MAEDDAAFTGPVKTVLYIVMILMFWQCGLYKWRSYDGSKEEVVTAAQRTCFEILGPCLELHVTPPSFILSLCSAVVPSTFDRHMATEQSSIMALHRVIMHWHQLTRSAGLLPGLWKGLGWTTVGAIVEASNWVRMLPSMLIFGPHTRPALWSLLLTSIFIDGPAPLGDLRAWFFVALFVCVVEWLVSDAPKLRRIASRGPKQRRAVLRFIALDAIYHVLIAPVIAFLICVMMITVVYALVPGGQ